MLDRLRYEQREEIWSNALHRQNGMEFVLVAEWIDGVYGFASGGRERSGYRGYQGELYAIYVLLAAQKRGAGRALFESLMSRLADRGYDSMLLWVLDGNPACGFYEAMGGQRVGHKDERFDDAVLREVAYGWPLDRR
jgi:GNAT superfamily N-acetyltransferase